jgi:hypothetical protein
MFFDMTMDRLELVSKCAEAARVALGEGDFDVAVFHMELGADVARRSEKVQVWAALTSDVLKLREISDKLAEEDN